MPAAAKPISGFALFFMASIHLYQMLMHPGLIGPYESADRVWSGRWTDRHGNRRAYLLACARLSVVLFVVLAGVAWATTAVPIDLSIMRVALVAAIVVAGISVSAWHGVGFTEMATMAGVQRAGTALGLGNTGAFTALGVTSLCLPHVLAWSSWPVVWLVTAGSALMALRVLPAVQK